jgi:hypothetical protein
VVVPATGTWRVELADKGDSVRIDGVDHAAGAVVSLQAGAHGLDGALDGRLVRVAEADIVADLDCSDGELFGGVYDW